MLDVPYGQGKSLMHGAVYKYVYTINMFSNFYIDFYLDIHNVRRRLLAPISALKLGSLSHKP